VARVLSDWLSAYLKYTENSEPPQSYHIWIGIVCLSSALQRKVYLRWGRSIIYPNLYVILVGPSGRAKKGTAIDFAKPLLYGANIKVIEGAITREKLIRRIAGSVENFTDASTGRLRFQCAVTFISDELSVFLGQQNIKLLGDLTNWYDCPDSWVYDTKTGGTDNLEGICFNMIAGTAPDWLPSILPREAVGGGFTSRVIWVVEEDKGKTVVFPSFDEKLEKALTNDLEQINLISGEFTLSDDAKAWYEAWYLEEEEKIKNGIPTIADPKLSGYSERRATLIKKLAMVMSISEDSSLVCRAKHFERALSFLRPIEKKMGRVFGGLGSARYAYATELMLNFIAKHKIVTRTQVLRFFFRDIDDYTFEVVSRTLEKMGVIKVEHDSTKREVILKLVEEKIGLLS